MPERTPKTRYDLFSAALVVLLATLSGAAGPFTLATGAATAATAATAARAASGSPPLALVGARIYPGPDEVPIVDGTILVENGKIVAVGPRDRVTVPDGAVRLDCAGAVITAGFQNSHVHFTEPHWMDAAHQPAAALAERLRAMLTRWGVTTAVDTASLLANTTALRRRIEAGEVDGPRILTAGEGLYPPDGIPFYLKDTLPPEILKLLPQPRTVEEVTALVERHMASGADITKLFTGSAQGHGKVLPMPEELAAAAVKATHAHRKLVFAHPSSLAGLEVALDARVDVLAHAVEDTRGMTPAHFARMKAQNMALIPTLKLFGDDGYLWDILDEVRTYARAGGQILFGTDVGYLTDYDPTTEYVLMSTAGLSWREILAALTTAPAQRFGEESRRGRIAPGMDADLVVLASDPVHDVRAFADVRTTVRGGRVIYDRPPAAAKP